MNRPVIGLARALPPALTQPLDALGEVWVGSDGTADLPDNLRVWVATPLDGVSAELIEQMPESVGLIANYGVGTDNIDRDAAKARGIAVSNTPVVAEDTADLAFALLLATCRRLTHCEAQLRSGAFMAGATHMSQRVHGKTLGIVGLGEIGQAVARRARGFDMSVLYTGPHRKPDVEKALDARFVTSLDELLSQSDIVSLHCGYSPDTHHLVNARTLSRMRPGAVLINTARGALVDEVALIEALGSGHLGAAGLDVFENEPAVNKSLFEFDNVTTLPHIGSATTECRADMAARVVANVAAFLDNGEPLDRVS